MHIVLKISSFLYSHNVYTDSTYMIISYLPAYRTLFVSLHFYRQISATEPLSKAFNSIGALYTYPNTEIWSTQENGSK